jgi:hypothetical protein
MIRKFTENRYYVIGITGIIGITQFDDKFHSN